ncbi:MAG: DUF4834 family protein [Candidatus Symbiothrix sp.]|nr:DUF4834 family protein [Candidatus Symbiothrix sp.]
MLIRWMFKGFIRSIFGQVQSMGNQQQQRKRSSSQQQQTQNPSKKVIASDEGEYVDYEEVKN